MNVFNIDHESGTYAKLVPDLSSIKQLYAFAKSCKFPQLVGQKNYHCTLIYSKNPCPHIAEVKVAMPILAKPTYLEEVQPGVVILNLNCPKACELFNLFHKDYNATHDFECYKPHITLSYDSGKIDIRSIDVPNMTIRFVQCHIEPLMDNQ